MSSSINNPTMDSYLRKQKPRPPTSTSRPPSTLTEAPRAIVRPTIAVRLEDRRRSTAPSSPPHVSRAPLTSEAPSSAPKPRKRFRKKLSGLFGDQTDLKKRMSKLLIEARADDIGLSGNSSERAVARGINRDMATASARLSGADGIIARLEESSAVRDTHGQGHDEFDTPEFVATASRALGSPEKLQTVRKTMGRLSPSSNEQFLAELKLGTPPRAKPASRVRKPITPPDLPSVDSSELDSEREWLSSPVSVERTGAPAVLRRKARRLDRGYRSVDVLRARLGGEVPKGKKRLEGFDLELEDMRGRARTNIRKDTEHMNNQGDLDTDTDEEIISPQRLCSGRRGQALPANDPFQMLVEVATVEQKNSTATAERDTHCSEQHGHKRKADLDRRESKRRRETRKLFTR